MHATGGAPFEGIEQRYQLKTMSIYNELKTKDDAWMQSVHECIDRLSAMIDGILFPSDRSFPLYTLSCPDFRRGKGLRGKYARRSRGRFATQRLCRLTLPPVGKYGLS